MSDGDFDSVCAQGTEEAVEATQNEGGHKPLPRGRRERVTTLDGRISLVKLGDAQHWNGQPQYDSDCETSSRRDLYKTPSGRWIISHEFRSLDALDDSYWNPAVDHHEVPIDDAAMWFAQEWADDGSEIPPEIEARLDGMDIDFGGALQETSPSSRPDPNAPSAGTAGSTPPARDDASTTHLTSSPRGNDAVSPQGPGLLAGSFRDPAPSPSTFPAPPTEANLNLSPGDLAVAAALALKREGEAVTVSAAAKRAQVNRSHLITAYPESVNFIKALGTPEGRMRRGRKSRETGAIETTYDDEI
jgi:hypothetical protein